MKKPIPLSCQNPKIRARMLVTAAAAGINSLIAGTVDSPQSPKNLRISGFQKDCHSVGRLLIFNPYPAAGRLTSK